MGQDAGFPPGITAGDLGRRFLAAVVDGVVPALAGGGAAAAIALAPLAAVKLVIAILCAVIAVAWVIVLWWTQGTRGASPGMKLMGLEVVAVENGQPIGWGRAIVRYLVFGVIGATGIGLVVMLLMLITHPRRQGWHDLAARAVVINAREQEPTTVLPGAGQQRSGGAGTVGLPPGLGGDQNAQSAPSYGAGAHASSYAGHQDPGHQAPGHQAQQGQVPQGHQVAPGQAPQHTAPGQQAAYGAQQAPHGTQQTPHGTEQTPYGMGSTSQPQDQQPPWGGPAASPNPFFAGSAAEDEGEPAESTRLVPRGGVPQRRPDEGWSIVLSDGRQVPVASLVLVGRNPQPRAGEEQAELISIVDQSRTVSKTHIAVGVDGKGLWVMDRGSTNGSAIAASNGTFDPCAAGEHVRVRDGQVVSFGDQRMEIRRTH